MLIKSFPMLTGFSVFAFIALACVVVVLIIRRRFRSLVRGDIARLLSGAVPEVGPVQFAAREQDLPEPVRQHLRYAIPTGAPAIRTVRMRHTGEMRLKPGARWFPVTGEQYFSAGAPGFVWNGIMRLAPLLSVNARDCLLAGHGNMLVKFGAAIPMADARGPQIDQASRLRWLAELTWFPYGFVSEAVQWEAIDERSARATLLKDGPPVSAIFEIDDEGRFVRISANRYRDLGGGKQELTPWTGSYGEYRQFDGFRVPSSIEVAWQLDAGEFTCIRFRITDIEFCNNL